MARGLIVKTIREVWLATLLFALALGTLEGVFAYVIPNFIGSELDEIAQQWLQVDFVRNMLRALLGTEIDTLIGPGSFAIGWTHPVALALLWAHAIILCTRVPAGEVDRGTIDVHLGLPVSRTRVYLCESAVWLVSGLCVVGMGVVGSLTLGWYAPPELKYSPSGLIIVVSNLYCLYIAVGGFALFVSSLSNRRGPAVGIVFGIVLASFLLSFLAQFWEPAQRLSFLTVLNYYRPMLIVRESAWPIGDILALLGVGIVTWLAGLIIFTRRDICTV